MVHFTQYCSRILYIQIFGWWYHYHRITPFGNPGVNGYVLLTLAYRSLSRPSSPLSSKASAIDLYSLDHIIISALFPLFPLKSHRQAGGNSFHSELKLLTFTNFRRLQKLKSLHHYVFLPLLFQRTKSNHSFEFFNYGTDKSWTYDPRLIRAVL